MQFVSPQRPDDRGRYVRIEVTVGDVMALAETWYPAATARSWDRVDPSSATRHPPLLRSDSPRANPRAIAQQVAAGSVR